MKVTLKMLQKNGACADGIARFRETFGESVNLTARLVMKHAKNFGWEMDFLVRGERDNRKFDRLLDEYTEYFEDLPRRQYVTVFPWAMAAALIELKKLPLGRPV